MKIIEFAIGIIGVAICISMVSVIYGKLNNKNLKIGYMKWTMSFLLLSILSFINNRFNVSGTTFMIHLIIISVMNKISYKDSIFDTIVNTIMIYVFIVICEIILTLLLIISSAFSDINDFSNNYVFITIFSATEMTLAYFIILNKHIKKFIIKFINLIKHKMEKSNFLFLIALMIIVGLTAYKLIFNYNSFDNYLINIFILILFIGVIVFLFIEALKLVKEKEKQESLLNYMAKYEELIDSQRINRHEMLNNLITLKSFKNKNSKEFTKALDELISVYDKNDLAGLQSIYNLPSGIKGLLYYKIYDIRNKGVEVVVNVGRNTISFFDNLESKYYMEICKVLGILLDNAGEAASKSKEKNVVIDIYKDNRNNKICVYIENSKTGEIDLKTINEKHVSSKGKGRGLGLFIVQGVVNKRECYELLQEVNNLKHFVTTFIIDIEKAK